MDLVNGNALSLERAASRPVANSPDLWRCFPYPYDRLIAGADRSLHMLKSIVAALTLSVLLLAQPLNASATGADCGKRVCASVRASLNNAYLEIYDWEAAVPGRPYIVALDRTEDIDLRALVSGAKTDPE